MVYEPREDSYLLAGEVEKRARGKVLDIGTGSGIQAVTALKRKLVKSVTAVDKDEEAVKFVRKMGLNTIKSDLFDKVEGKYDLIIFNPPYLPNDSRVKDIAVDGGPEGIELLFKFLEESPKYLEKGGEVLFVQSSITGIEKTERKLDELGFTHRIIAREKIPWEELIVFSCKLD